MDVYITSWALHSYMDLKADNVFTTEDYKTVLRPGVELLKKGFPPTDPEFSKDNFWGPVRTKGGEVVKNGYKMKWHGIGPGKVQLRLLIGIVQEAAFLCDAYVKKGEKDDYRFAAKLMIRIRDLEKGEYVKRGKL